MIDLRFVPILVARLLFVAGSFVLHVNLEFLALNADAAESVLETPSVSALRPGSQARSVAFKPRPTEWIGRHDIPDFVKQKLVARFGEEWPSDMAIKDQNEKHRPKRRYVPPYDDC